MHKNTKTLLYILYLLLAVPLRGAVFGLGLRIWFPVDWVDCAFYTLSLGLGGVLLALRKERAREAFFEHRGRAGLDLRTPLRAGALPKRAVGLRCRSSYC